MEGSTLHLRITRDLGAARCEKRAIGYECASAPALGPVLAEINIKTVTQSPQSGLVHERTVLAACSRDLFAKSWCPSGVQSVWLEGDTWVLVRLYRLRLLSRVVNGLSLTLVFTVICFGCFRRIRLTGPAATTCLVSCRHANSL